MWGITNKKIDNSNSHDFWCDWKVGICLPSSYDDSGRSWVNKPWRGKTSYSVKPSIATKQIAATSYPFLENPSTLSSSVPNDFHVLFKSHSDFRIEQIGSGKPDFQNVEVTALKSFIMEQFYAIKKSVKFVEYFRSENLDQIT